MARHPDNAFAYTQQEQALIAQALAEAKPWNAPCAAPLKTRIYAYHKDLQKEMCCYCLRNHIGEFKLVIDTEHILPKEKYRPHMFEIWNLSVSCKRCNMKVKGQRIDFLADATFASVGTQDNSAYHFVHPNLDEVRQHLSRVALEVDGERLVSYVVKGNSAKGTFHVDYFRLRELEIATFDAAQIEGAEENASAALEGIRAVVRDLARSTGNAV
ncbi:HNH endonuclease [Collimonas sp. OK412]|jgi:hypothetical protein|uniref:HNH endonuclease n=1 Tax=Collimonas sp. (strain OK412) TaxID=1801619 RepID=UPI0008EACB05|nr:hypothetical protein [Collimonas sp. OK412]SFD01084.1 hypothetical protein SAMN04515619_11953 [Collimonas sp. OK412]